MPAEINYTLTFSESVKGWPSFYSYMPDMILGMNQYLYTFKGGSLYRHNTNEIRNRYYGIDYDSTITGVFNQEPTTVKVFKTIEHGSYKDVPASRKAAILQPITRVVLPPII